MKDKYDIFTDLVKKINSGEMAELQKMLLSKFNELVRECYFKKLLEYGAFIVLDNEFLMRFYGDEIISPKYDIYHGNRCTFTNKLMIPLWGFDGRVHGFCGYDKPSDDMTEEQRSLFVSYRYQTDLIYKNLSI